jgi:hypothetical protein
MNKLAVAEELLLSRQFSFGVNGGIKQVILTCIVALHITPDALLLDLDSGDAHSFCSRDIVKEELDINNVYHYMLKSFGELYGKTVTVQ